jgi:hypothetical protein
LTGAKVPTTEWSVAASNYHGKLLGAILALLILHSALVTLASPFLHIMLNCDDCGVISHSNSSLASLPEKQKQSDPIRLIKFLVGSKRCRTTWEWVEGHAVERKRKTTLISS